METPSGQTGWPRDWNKIVTTLRTPQEITLLQQIRDSNNAIKRLDAEYLALFRTGRLDECVRKRMAIEFAKKYINGLCAQHKRRYGRKSP